MPLQSVAIAPRSAASPRRPRRSRPRGRARPRNVRVSDPLFDFSADEHSRRYSRTRDPSRRDLSELAPLDSSRRSCPPPLGDVYASDEGRMLAEMGDRSFKLGNVHTHTYRDLFGGQLVRGLVEASCLETLPGCTPDGRFVPVLGNIAPRPVQVIVVGTSRTVVHSGLIDFAVGGDEVHLAGLVVLASRGGGCRLTLSDSLFAIHRTSAVTLTALRSP
jgi:hypothetical protein